MPSRRHAPSPSPQLPLGAPAAVFRARPGMAGLGLRAPHRPPRLGRLAPAPPPPPPPPQGSGLPAASTWLPRGLGRTGLPAPSPAVRPHRVPTEAPRPPRPPSRGCGSRRSPERLREARGGVCVMGRGLGNGGAAWEGPLEPGSPTRPRLEPRPRRPRLPPPSPHGLRYLPVHCRTGQSFAPKNRATQPASHTSGEKMAARARRKLPKVPERTGQRAAAERAERAGARRRETSGGAQGPGEWAPPPLAASACPRACSRPLRRACCSGWLGVLGSLPWAVRRETACSLYLVCLRLARTATLLSGRFHFSLQPQAALPPPTKANPRPSPVTGHSLSPREKT